MLVGADLCLHLSSAEAVDYWKPYWTSDTYVHAKTPTGGTVGEGELPDFMVDFLDQYVEFIGPRCYLTICVLQYFHPDHMSSDEKMKLELKRVRDEFKMSESDCGSARIQGMDQLIEIPETL